MESIFWHLVYWAVQIVPPISLSTTYKQDRPGEPKGHDYSRAGINFYTKFPVINLFVQEIQHEVSLKFVSFVKRILKSLLQTCCRKCLRRWKTANFVSVIIWSPFHIIYENLGRTFSSGLSATMSMANILKTGDHIICCDDVYGGAPFVLSDFW